MTIIGLHMSNHLVDEVFGFWFIISRFCHKCVFITKLKVWIHSKWSDKDKDYIYVSNLTFIFKICADGIALHCPFSHFFFILSGKMSIIFQKCVWLIRSLMLIFFHKNHYHLILFSFHFQFGYLGTPCHCGQLLIGHPSPGQTCWNLRCF